MAMDIPTWGQWTSHYDPANQAASMVDSVADDGLSVNFTLDRLTLLLQGAQDSPFAAALGMAGQLTVSLPETLDLIGFLLVLNGHVERTPGSQAVIACSIGHGARSLEWPLTSVAGAPSAPLPETSAEDAGEASILEADFRLECFTSDFNPATVGKPPFPPLPAFPITMSMQARRRAADEVIGLTITDFRVIIARSA